MPVTCLPRASNPPIKLECWKTFLLVSCLTPAWMEEDSPVLYLHGEQARPRCFLSTPPTEDWAWWLRYIGKAELAGLGWAWTMEKGPTPLLGAQHGLGLHPSSQITPPTPPGPHLHLASRSLRHSSCHQEPMPAGRLTCRTLP